MNESLMRQEFRGSRMPFTPVAVLDAERLKATAQVLCDVFGLASLHPHQEEAGQNVLKGISTLLDVPTGGGKTIAFWYALFYHWQPGNTDEKSQKIVLVVGPLVALLESQAKLLNEKGIPAVAVTSRSKDISQLLTNLGRNKFRIGLVGPEMALSTEFHEKVLNQITFTRNIISLVIDELHCICEWGTDDFRPEYRDIIQLAARLPTGLPILGATATAPYHVIRDILDNLGLPSDTARIQVSNEKLNVSLSVRILQQEPDSYTDLLFLFDDDAVGAEGFLQSLIYTNNRQDTEKIQDFLRDNAPASIDAVKAFEFYHRYIDEDEKDSVQDRIEEGELRGVSATDALGIGMDFKAIMRVILWMKPRTFLSLVQKIGRCVRDRRQRGEAVLFITKAMYERCCVELDLLRDEQAEAAEASASSDDVDEPEKPQDRDAALAEESTDEEELPVAPAKKRRRKTKGKKQALSQMELRDKRYLLEYITTLGCRRIPWNKFFGNRDKRHLHFPVPPGPCCDNCNPEAFQIETIVLEGGHQLKGGRKGKSSPELEMAVREKLNVLREQFIADDYPMQHFLTGNAILADDVIDTLAKRARLISSVETLRSQTRWMHTPKYGEKVVAAIQEILLDFPDLDREELRSRLLPGFEACWDAVYVEMEAAPAQPAGTRKRKQPPPRRRCQLFLKLPSKTVFPDYYEQIEAPISMKNIKTLCAKATHYTSIIEYRAAWHLLFANALKYNEPGSEIYEDATHLKQVFDRKLYAMSVINNLPGWQELPVTIPSRAGSEFSTPPPVEDLLQSQSIQ
ncbi:P-loop containing nucleoside triphosphate hydrolase protein [Mycena crocata]|nr:P-loop containing nucleoside triphosphate hydrolase protein [Mycena crocata]